MGEPQKERARQMSILDTADRRFTQRYKGVIDKASGQMISRFEATGADPMVPVDFERQLRDAFIDMAGVMIPAFGVHEQKSFLEFLQRLAEEYIEQEAIRRRIVGITESTRRLIINSIKIGQQQGEGVSAIAARMRDVVPHLNFVRSRMIARTETHGAANYGAFRTAVEQHRIREWVSADDIRTRDFGEADAEVDEWNHREMNGQQENGNGVFVVRHKLGGTEALRFPGDPNGSAGNVINCRCAVINRRARQ